jgi:hypothetical protein
VWCTILQQYLDYLGATLSSGTVTLAASSSSSSTGGGGGGALTGVGGGSLKRTNSSSQSLLSPGGAQRANARLDSEKIAAEMVRQVRTTLCLSLLPAEHRSKAHLLNDLVGVDCEAVMSRTAQSSSSDPEKEVLPIMIALMKALTEVHK